MGERYLVVVPLPSAPGVSRVLMVARDDHCFTPRERDLLTLLRPHLLEPSACTSGDAPASRT